MLRHICIRRLVEAHVTVADLNKMETTDRLLVSFLVVLGRREKTRLGDSAGCDRPNDSRACPGHTLEKSSAVNAIFVIVIVKNVLIVTSALGRHGFALLIPPLV